MNDPILEDLYFDVTNGMSILENYLRVQYEGKNPVDIENSEKIQLPNGFIRTAYDFRVRYNLKDIVHDEALISNITYQLQFLDFCRYLLERFNIFLSVGNVFRKYVIVHIYSINEAILFGALKQQATECADCKHHHSCANFISKSSYFPNIRKAAEKIFNLGEEYVDILISLKEIRDNIHIHTVQTNEFTNDIYNLELYNKGLRSLNILRDNLLTSIQNHRAARNCKCFPNTLVSLTS